MSNGTTVAELREKLSTLLDSASQKPILTNRDEERFTLMSEEIYRELQQKVLEQQSSLIAALESQKNTKD